MPLLAELEVFGLTLFYQYVAPNGAFIAVMYTL
jgi:hypothetical protein